MKLLFILLLLVGCKEATEELCFKASQVCNCTETGSTPVDDASLEKFCVEARKACGCQPAPTPIPTIAPTVVPTIQPTVIPTAVPTANPTPSTGYINLKECNQVVGFVWKLNKDGNTAVVHNKAYVGCKFKTNGKYSNLAGGIFSNDGRPYVRWKGHPTQFKSPAYVEAVCDGVTKVTVKIPDTGKRCAYYAGGWGD